MFHRVPLILTTTAMTILGSIAMQPELLAGGAPCDCAVVFMDGAAGTLASNGKAPTLAGVNGPCSAGAAITIHDGPPSASGFLIAAMTADVIAANSNTLFVPIQLDGAGSLSVSASNISGMLGMHTSLQAAFFDSGSFKGYTMTNELVMEVSTCCTSATTVPAIASGCHKKKEVSTGTTVSFAANALGNVIALQFLPPEDSSQPYMPMSDFQATVCAGGMATASFYREGAYLVNVVHDLGVETVSVLVDIAIGEEKGDKNEECGSVNLPLPTDDVLIVDCPPAECDNGFDKNAKKALTGETGAGNVDDAIKAICDAYNANGMMKVCVYISGHGSPGNISLGDGQKSDDSKRLGFKAGTCEPTDKTKEFINKVKGKVKSINLFGCNTGAGEAGCKLLQKLADGTGAPACAYDSTVYWSCSKPSVKKGGKKVTKQPAMAN